MEIEAAKGKGFTTEAQSSGAARLSSPKSFGRATRLSSSKSHAEVRNQIVLATLWRALARGWPRRRTSPSSVESPCEVGTSTRTIYQQAKQFLGKILAGEQNFDRQQRHSKGGMDLGLA